MVRVPRNIITTTNIKFPGYKNLDLTLRTKWPDKAEIMEMKMLIEMDLNLFLMLS